MVNFEKNIIESSGYLGKSKSPEFNLGGQRNNDKATERSARREVLEDSVEKANMLNLLLDEMVGKLSLPENYELIDKAVGEEGVSTALANKIWEYTKKLGNKNIIPNSSAKDILFSQDVAILGWVERAQRKGLKDEYKEIIKDEFNFLRNYINLLSSSTSFEKEELSHKLGFLEGKFGSEQLELIRKNEKNKYLKLSKEFLNS
ncbi:MAG TPA: hypothetical protein DIT25_04720 [Candidatus Moranbacteria bacterium]|nr:hypothetical protein [Candidatus Moranbacteria bacterium]